MKKGGRRVNAEPLRVRKGCTLGAGTRESFPTPRIFSVVGSRQRFPFPFRLKAWCRLQPVAPHPPSPPPAHSTTNCGVRGSPSLPIHLQSRTQESANPRPPRGLGGTLATPAACPEFPGHFGITCPVTAGPLAFFQELKKQMARPSRCEGGGDHSEDRHSHTHSSQNSP